MQVGLQKAHAKRFFLRATVCPSQSSSCRLRREYLMHIAAHPSLSKNQSHLAMQQVRYQLGRSPSRSDRCYLADCNAASAAFLRPTNQIVLVIVIRKIYICA